MTVGVAAAMFALGVALASRAIAMHRRPPRRLPVALLAVVAVLPALAVVWIPTLGMLLAAVAIAGPALMPPRRGRVGPVARPGSD